MQTTLLKKIFLGLLLWNSVTVEGQVVSINKANQGVAFAGGLNEIQFSFKKYTCNNIFLSTKNGSLKKQTNCCYQYIPVDTGYATIEVKVREGGKIKKLEDFKILVKEPNTYFFIGPSKGGDVKKGTLEFNEYARVESFDFNCSYYYPFSIDSFNVQIKRDGIDIFHIWNRGNHFNENLTSAFRQTQKNDSVIISEIVGRTPIRKRKILTQTVFNIIE